MLHIVTFSLTIPSWKLQIQQLNVNLLHISNSNSADGALATVSRLLSAYCVLHEVMELWDAGVDTQTNASLSLARSQLFSFCKHMCKDRDLSLKQTHTYRARSYFSELRQSCNSLSSYVISLCTCFTSTLMCFNHLQPV